MKQVLQDIRFQFWQIAFFCVLRLGKTDGTSLSVYFEKADILINICVSFLHKSDNLCRPFPLILRYRNRMVPPLLSLSRDVEVNWTGTGLLSEAVG